ncbi:MAG: hypothetical protein ABEJ95_04970 [Candidatus Nanohalobium sp.]
MFQGQQLFEDVIQELNQWIPSKAYGHERKFQDELQDYLDENLNQGGGLMGQQRDIPVSKEHGSSKADIAVDGSVGIEMKRDLTNSQKKKLRGQIEDYLDNYNHVIVLACGVKDKDGWRELKNKYQGHQGFDGGQVEFVWKKKENYGKSSSQSRGQDPLGGSLF